jgi:hypothetical protein
MATAKTRIFLEQALVDVEAEGSRFVVGIIRLDVRERELVDLAVPVEDVE